MLASKLLTQPDRNRKSLTSIFFLTFYFTLEYSRLTNTVVIVSGEQQRDSAIHIYASVVTQTPLPSRLPHTEHRAEFPGLYSRSLLVFHFKYSSVYMSILVC